MAKLIVKRKKGKTQVPVYMRDYTKESEYNYEMIYRGFKAYLIRNSPSSWWVVSNGKWVSMGNRTKTDAEREFEKFVDIHYDKLVEKGFIREGD